MSSNSLAGGSVSSPMLTAWVVAMYDLRQQGGGVGGLLVRVGRVPGRAEESAQWFGQCFGGDLGDRGEQCEGRPANRRGPGPRAKPGNGTSAATPPPNRLQLHTTIEVGRQLQQASGSDHRAWVEYRPWIAIDKCCDPGGKVVDQFLGCRQTPSSMCRSGPTLGSQQVARLTGHIKRPYR
jgi:hypothetical protein